MIDINRDIFWDGDDGDPNYTYCIIKDLAIDNIVLDKELNERGIYEGLSMISDPSDNESCWYFVNHMTALRFARRFNKYCHVTEN